MNSTVWGIFAICASMFVSTVGATWAISNRFGRIETRMERGFGKVDTDIANVDGKLDSHLSYHKGLADGLQVHPN